MKATNKITFGKYQKQTWIDIVKIDRQYVQWIVTRHKNLNESLKQSLLELLDPKEVLTQELKFEQEEVKKEITNEQFLEITNELLYPTFELEGIEIIEKKKYKNEITNEEFLEFTNELLFPKEIPHNYMNNINKLNTNIKFFDEDEDEVTVEAELFELFSQIDEDDEDEEVIVETETIQIYNENKKQLQNEKNKLFLNIDNFMCLESNFKINLINLISLEFDKEFLRLKNNQIEIINNNTKKQIEQL